MVVTGLKPAGLKLPEAFFTVLSAGFVPHRSEVRGWRNLSVNGCNVNWLGISGEVSLFSFCCLSSSPEETCSGK